MKKEFSKPLSDENYAELKAKHGELYEIKHENADGSVQYYYLRVPTKHELSLAINQSKKEGAAEVLLKNCFVHGDEALKSDVRAAVGILGHVDTICEVKIAEVKKR